MTHHHARLVAVAIAAVSFSTPITAQQEPTPPATLEALVETLGGRVSQNEQGDVVGVSLAGTQVTDAGVVHLTGLTALMAYAYGRPNLRDVPEPETPITIELNIPKPPGVMRADSTG